MMKTEKKKGHLLGCPFKYVGMDTKPHIAVHVIAVN
jgi:hypothetical protein